MRNKEELIWMDTINDFWWSNYITAIRFVKPGDVEMTKVE